MSDHDTPGHVLPARTWPSRLFTAAALRKLLWRTVLTLTGGIRRTGRLPSGPAILVANHASHADTAALLAVLPAWRRPVAVAAAEYWFTRRWRRLVMQTLVAGLPVQRTGEGGYASLLEVAGPALARGQHVVIFPEGTRSKDGTLGRFRSGAVRLAHDCGVPLVPVALLGTGGILPKHGWVQPQSIEVRVGEPVRAEDLGADGPEELRSRVRQLRDAGAPNVPVSPVWSWMARFAGSRALLPAAFVWGVAEALSWPIVVEMFLAFFVVCLPRRVLPAGAALLAGSVTGVLIHAVLARNGVLLPMPLTTARMVAQAGADLAAGAVGIREQPLNGIPVKVYARSAGLAGTDLAALAWHTALARGVRILSVAVVLTGAAWLIGGLLRRWYGTYLIAVALVFGVLLSAVVQRWA